MQRSSIIAATVAAGGVLLAGSAACIAVVNVASSNVDPGSQTVAMVSANAGQPTAAAVAPRPVPAPPLMDPPTVAPAVEPAPLPSLPVVVAVPPSTLTVAVRTTDPMTAKPAQRPYVPTRKPAAPSTTKPTAPSTTQPAPPSATKPTVGHLSEPSTVAADTPTARPSAPSAPSAQRSGTSRVAGKVSHRSADHASTATATATDDGRIVAHARERDRSAKEPVAGSRRHTNEHGDADAPTGTSPRGDARQDNARQDSAREDDARQDDARQGSAAGGRSPDENTHARSSHDDH